MEANTRVFVDDTSMIKRGDMCVSIEDVLIPVVLDFAKKVARFKLKLSQKDKSHHPIPK